MSLIDVVTLDRQAEYLLGIADPVAFLRQLKRWMTLLSADPRIAGHMQDFVYEWQRELALLEAVDGKCVSVLRSLISELCELAPELDDRTLEPTDGAWRWSLASFDSIASGPMAQVALDRPTDPTRTSRLMEILVEKLRHVRERGLATDEWLDEMMRRRDNVSEQIGHALRAFDLEHLSSPGRAVIALQGILAVLNPQPIVLAPGDSMMAHYTEFLADLFGHEVRKAMQWGAGSAEALRKFHASAHEDARRLHVNLVLRVSMRMSLVTLLDRYASRCELYERTRLLKLASGSNSEAALKRELMLWLFDQGLNPLAEADVGGLRADLLDSGRLIVEVKRYRKSAREEIVTGVRELRDHALRLVGTPHFAREACYVVFREAGPIYELPREVQFGEITIITKLVDLGPNDEAGSRRREKVNSIPLAEFLHE